MTPVVSTLRRAAQGVLEQLERRSMLSADGVEGFDYGDAPDAAAALYFYPTLLLGFSGNPARHVITPVGPRLGLNIDAEADGQPNLPATGDDINLLGPGAADDEDGVTAFGFPLEMITLTPGGGILIDIHNPAGPGLLNAWFDWNQDGNWGPGEQVATNVVLPAPGTTTIGVAVPAGLVSGSFVYSRFRVSSFANLAPGGIAMDGEVEDYRQQVLGTTQQLDFGDAPETTAGPFQYPTMLGGLSGNPARHIIAAGAPRLGANIDAEPDGQQSLPANGDDIAGLPDDEDGITIGGLAFETVPLQSGSTTTIQVTNPGGAGRLNAWFDWNQDGTWTAAEQVFTNQPIPNGVSNLSFNVPGGLSGNAAIYSRFRINTLGALATTGLAADGEVEDYRSRVIPDTTAPKAIAGTLEYQTRQAITVAFDEPINPATVGVADLSALNLDDGTTPVATSVVMGPGNTTATWTFNTPGTFISDGDYSFSMLAGAVADTSGNPLALPFNLSGPGIFFFGADANRDRFVNAIDFSILATNFGTAGKPFSLGNFNYDAAGNVNANDFSVLASRFGTAIAQPQPIGFQPDLPSPFSKSKIPGDEPLLELLA